MDIMFSSVIGDYFSLYSITVIMVSALVSGVIFGCVYIFTQKAGVQDGVAFIIIFLVSVSIFTLLAKDSLPKAVAALGLICFLGLKSGSFFKNPTYIFCSCVCGFVCGIGYTALAIFAAIFMGVSLIIIYSCSNKAKNRHIQVKIVCGESFDFDTAKAAFDKIASAFDVLSVKKSANGGTETEIKALLKNGVSPDDAVGTVCEAFPEAELTLSLSPVK